MILVLLKWNGIKVPWAVEETVLAEPKLMPPLNSVSVCVGGQSTGMQMDLASA